MLIAIRATLSKTNHIGFTRIGLGSIPKPFLFVHLHSWFTLPLAPAVLTVPVRLVVPPFCSKTRSPPIVGEPIPPKTAQHVCAVCSFGNAVSCIATQWLRLVRSR